MSRYSIRVIDDSERQAWNDFIEKSEQGTVFHKYEWLKILEKHSNYSLVPIVVFKGDVQICAIPLFKKTILSVKILLSPPNGCGIPYLGPVFIPDSQKQYKKEKTYFYAIDEAFDFIFNELGFDYIRVVCSPYCDDLRPFLWKGCIVKLNYTYKIDLSQGKESIYRGFDKRIREGIRSAEKYNNIIVREDDIEDIYRILTLVKERYALQGRKYKVEENYIRDIINSSLKEHVRIITAEINGETIAGSITLCYKEKVQDWIGATTPKEKVTGLNELLHWRIIQQAVDANFRYFESIGANTRHLCDHKSKYNPELISYHVVEKTSLKGKLAFNVFNLFQS